MTTHKYCNKHLPEIQELLGNVKCLIVTATEIEKNSFQEKFKPINDEGIIRLFHKNNTFFIGKFGNYLVAHVQLTLMGGINPGGSLSTVKDGINVFGTKAVIMLGIAFGIDKKKQKIGDVLISESIIPYNIARVSKNATEYRNNIPFAGAILFNRFKNLYADWEFSIRKDVAAKVIFGKLLTGESLIDNVEYRDLLVNEFVGVIGGEMEGAGLFAAAHESNIEWIIAKGICDFADGNKGRNKKNNQKIAAEASIALCEHILSVDSVLKELNIPEFSIKREAGKAFNEKWALHNFKHFAILASTIAEHSSGGKIQIKLEIKNIKEDIATCYVVIKIARNRQYDTPVFNSDVDLDEKEVETYKVYDIYPDEYKTFQTVIQLPISEVENDLEYKIEVWSPKRFDFKFVDDSRIALFDKTTWKKIIKSH
ncbi:hypothetical protein [Pedobacter sp. GR22-10]|uniref:5'-methylthioadenosine/S-adenosylhomocysteine nucleosidase family protein n=1 Tax=Pedobacter sp. GR22-10 TaxID=2994472 RepID=UPI002247EACA|nr:hypothetical protein [Pedobacter sp. GR22-10]MCX2429934.1 hypothetical protein [Pedobacter sp. GR22-10]